MAKSNKSAEEKYKGFHGKAEANLVDFELEIPDKMIYIGKAFAINYKSDKWDGVSRYYEHKLKQHGDILISPDGKTILITGLNLDIKPEGLTG